jgi:hypothetical protein
MRLETYDVYVMGYMNPAVHNLLISTLIAVALDGCNGCFFCCIGAISGHVLVQCLKIEGSRPGISVYD